VLRRFYWLRAFAPDRLPSLIDDGSSGSRRKETDRAVRFDRALHANGAVHCLLSCISVIVGRLDYLTLKGAVYLSCEIGIRNNETNPGRLWLAV
jgi:hypothetical protein